MFEISKDSTQRIADAINHWPEFDENTGMKEGDVYTTPSLNIISAEEISQIEPVKCSIGQDDYAIYAVHHYDATFLAFIHSDGTIRCIKIKV